MESLQSLDIYHVDHLFLLLGENNLPNAVAALSLVKQGGAVYLIHTDRTQPKAQHLQDFLRETQRLGKVQLVDLARYQAEPSVIRERLGKVARNLSGSVGMNYTGGTKVMAVHAYRLLADLYSDAVFSYLDSNTSEMVVDDDFSASPRVKLTLKLSMKSLFRLYGRQWKPQSPPREQPLLAAAAMDFAELHQNKALAKVWRDWCNYTLRRWARDPDRKEDWLPEWQLSQINPLPVNRLPSEWIRVLQRHLGCGTDTWQLEAAVKVGLLNPEPEPLRMLCQWLDGVWLEHYTLAQVQQIADSCGIHEAKMSLNIADPQNIQRNLPKFEFDVAFMRHYQLFALSCSATEHHKLCKQKLIEARVRSRELGGIEARVGLVCLSDRPEWLQEEVATETRDLRVAVFGRQHLLNLGESIRAWIQVNS